MIRYLTGDLFESGAECIVNTVNCEGFMGRGIAYQFKARYPGNFESYAEACKSGRLRPGIIHTFKENGVWIVNFPTKDKWRGKSKMSYVETGLDRLRAFIDTEHIKSIAIPPLGCGNGGLDWDEVKVLCEEKLEGADCDIMLYAPGGAGSIPVAAPKVGISGMILLKIKMQLEKVNAARLHDAAFMVNYYSDKEFFKFDKIGKNVRSTGIDADAKNLGAYQKFNSISDTQDTYDHIYNVVCSRRSDTLLNALLPAAEKACTFVNDLDDDKKLDDVILGLYTVLENEGRYDAGQLSEIVNAESVEYLEEKEMIVRNILGCFTAADRNN